MSSNTILFEFVNRVQLVPLHSNLNQIKRFKIQLSIQCN